MTWRVITLYTGLVTSNSDQTLTLDPNGFNATTVPGGMVVSITNVTAMCVDATAGRQLTLWKVASGGSIGDASQLVYQFPTIQRMPVVVYSAPNVWNGWIMTEDMTLHAKASTANKIQLEITALIDDFSGGQITL